MNILHIDSSPLVGRSVSRELSAQIVARILEHFPNATITRRDLALHSPPHAGAEAVDVVRYKKDQDLTELQVRETALADTLIAELHAADVIVIGSPMYNYTVTTQLKAWIDRVCQAGRTFRYTPDGSVGLLNSSKRAIIAISRGGNYTNGKQNHRDFQVPYLKEILGFVGITYITFVVAEGVNLSPEARAQVIKRATAEINVIVRALALATPHVKTSHNDGRRNQMDVPQTNYKSPFRFSRVSHSVFTSRDLKKSEEFYTEVLGLAVSDSDKDTLYLRGLEERGHHSLVIKRTTDAPAYERAGLRVFDEEALDRCKHTFEQHQLPCQWVERPFQGRTLHAVDVCGTPLEICASMDRKPRLDMDVYKHKGAQARRFDHYQITIPDIEKATRFYTSVGCRIADYITAGGHPIGVFLQMKDTPYDLVFLERDGPAFHHFGYIIPDIQAMLRACDTMGELGWNNNVEYGPGKHGVGHSYYVYILDPDGHRCELLLPPIVYMDREDEPHVWDVITTERATEAWGLPPRESWFSHRSMFNGVNVTAPAQGGAPMTLEKYLQVAK